jgi:hypothetical protein
MKLKQRQLRFTPSPSPDVVAYRLYFEPAPAPATYESPNADLGLPAVDETTGKAAVDLAGLPGMTTTDGTYNLGLVAVDDAGNQSSMEVLADVPLDFIAPDAPTALELADI